MRKSLAALALMLAITANATTAVAQGVEPIDMKGRWMATSDAIVKGVARHHAPVKGIGPRVDHTQITYTISGQDGRTFWGTISSKLGSEPIMGVIGFDGKTIVARDDDGLYQGDIIDRDTIDVIYSHANAKSVVVAAHRFKRQKLGVVHEEVCDCAGVDAGRNGGCRDCNCAGRGAGRSQG